MAPDGISRRTIIDLRGAAENFADKVRRNYSLISSARRTNFQMRNACAAAAAAAQTIRAATEFTLYANYFAGAVYAGAAAEVRSRARPAIKRDKTKRGDPVPLPPPKFASEDLRNGPVNWSARRSI